MFYGVFIGLGRYRYGYDDKNSVAGTEGVKNGYFMGFKIDIFCPTDSESDGYTIEKLFLHSVK